jgi:hypothetical protein
MDKLEGILLGIFRGRTVKAFQNKRKICLCVCIRNYILRTKVKRILETQQVSLLRSVDKETTYTIKQSEGKLV